MVRLAGASSSVCACREGASTTGRSCSKADWEESPGGACWLYIVLESSSAAIGSAIKIRMATSTLYSAGKQGCFRTACGTISDNAHPAMVDRRSPVCLHGDQLHR